MAIAIGEKKYTLTVNYELGVTPNEGYVLSLWPNSPVVVEKQVSDSSIPIGFSSGTGSLKPIVSTGAIGCDDKNNITFPTLVKDLSFDVTIIKRDNTTEKFKVIGNSSYLFKNQWLSSKTGQTYNHGGDLTSLIPVENITNGKLEQTSSTILRGVWNNPTQTWINNKISSLPTQSNFDEVFNTPTITFVVNDREKIFVYSKNFRYWTFLGYGNSSTSSEVLSPSTIISKPITLYPKYREEGIRLGGFYAPKEVPTGDPTVIQFSLNLDPNGGTFLNGSSSIVSSSVYLTYSNNFQYWSFGEETLKPGEYCSGSLTSRTYNANWETSLQQQTLSLPNPTSLSNSNGMKCIGWSVTGDETSTVYTDFITLTENNIEGRSLTLKAVWKDVQYTITYSHPAYLLNYEFEEGENIPKGIKYPFEDITISDIIPKVKIPTEKKMTVTIHYKNKSSTQEFNSLATLTFSHWKDLLLGTIYRPGEIYSSDRDIRLESVWTLTTDKYKDIKIPIMDTTKQTVELLLKDDDTEKIFFRLTSDIYLGDKFIGWSLTQGGDIIDRNTPLQGTEPQDDFDVYAITEQEGINKSFLLRQPWKKGKKFVAWVDDKNVEYQPYSRYTVTQKSTTLTAKWEPEFLSNEFSFCKFNPNQAETGYLYVFGYDNRWHAGQLKCYTDKGWEPVTQDSKNIKIQIDIVDSKYSALPFYSLTPSTIYPSQIISSQQKTFIFLFTIPNSEIESKINIGFTFTRSFNPIANTQPVGGTTPFAASKPTIPEKNGPWILTTTIHPSEMTVDNTILRTIDARFTSPKILGEPE